MTPVETPHSDGFILAIKITTRVPDIPGTVQERARVVVIASACRRYLFVLRALVDSRLSYVLNEYILYRSRLACAAIFRRLSSTL